MLCEKNSGIRRFLSAPSHSPLVRTTHKMSKAPTSTYSLIELPPISSFDSNHLQLPSKTSESHSSEHGPPARTRFLKPHPSPSPTLIQSKSPRSIPSFESIEAFSLDGANDLHHDGPNSVSRGLQTDISSASVIDWVLAQKTSSTADRYMNIEIYQRDDG